MEIPSVVIDRLPLYARALATLDSNGREVVSSQELGNHLNVTPAQIRKDLSYFGRFGKQGRGYNVRKLLDELRRILGLNRQWRIAIVGAGRLGKAIAGYEGFTPQGFRIAEAFDSDPAMIGSTINSLVIKNTEHLETVLSENPVDIGIVAVPADSAQKVIDSLVRCGVRAILNYAPIAAHVPPGVQIKRIDPVLALQGMTYYLKSEAASPRR
ncbi:MAG: redox-sensing transcriptional repressor Rex [Chloroflexi bacterium]|nr:redox-sensing transcriptional repressor Rex [Chloroflexota bacterium]